MYKYMYIYLCICMSIYIYIWVILVFIVYAQGSAAPECSPTRTPMDSSAAMDQRLVTWTFLAQRVHHGERFANRRIPYRHDG